MESKSTSHCKDLKEVTPSHSIPLAKSRLRYSSLWTKSRSSSNAIYDDSHVSQSITLPSKSIATSIKGRYSKRIRPGYESPKSQFNKRNPLKEANRCRTEFKQVPEISFAAVSSNPSLKFVGNSAPLQRVKNSLQVKEEKPKQTESLKENEQKSDSDKLKQEELEGQLNEYYHKIDELQDSLQCFKGQATKDKQEIIQLTEKLNSLEIKCKRSTQENIELISKNLELQSKIDLLAIKDKVHFNSGQALPSASEEIGTLKKQFEPDKQKMDHIRKFIAFKKEKLNNQCKNENLLNS